MRELSISAVLLGAALSAVLSAANAYLGLFAGMTVSASIPAAVVSMAILRLTGGTILENNLVQTAASAGESSAAGAIFTLPALILLGAWADFDYLTTTALIGVGGVLGVLFTIPLRRVLVVDSTLPFPEGVATAAVLRAGHGQASSQEDDASSPKAQSAVPLLVGSAFAAVVKLLETGMGLMRPTLEAATFVGGRTLYFGSGTSPALCAVGYIVGLNVAVLMCTGGLINWLLFVPFAADSAGGDALNSAWTAWLTETRYLGVGAMTVGGLWTLVSMRRQIVLALRLGTGLGRTSPDVQLVNDPSEQDLPRGWVLGGTLAMLVPIALIFAHLLGSWGLAAFLSVLVLAFGFLFAAVAAYMAGLVGSSNNPVSGVTIATILLTSLLLSFLGVEASGALGQAGPAAAIIVGTVVCTAAAIGGDNMQDLKAGRLLGARPSRQQILQLVGVVAAALVMAPVLSLLLDAYGFGPKTPEHPGALKAPQATLMAAVAQGVFQGGLPWKYVIGGAILGAVVILVDEILKARGSTFRAPVLAVAVGIYLPLELSVPVLLGGVVAHLRRGSGSRGLLLAAGMITGEALMGIVLAGALSSLGGWDALRPFGELRVVWLSFAALGLTLALLARRGPQKPISV